MLLKDYSISKKVAISLCHYIFLGEMLYFLLSSKCAISRLSSMEFDNFLIFVGSDFKVYIPRLLPHALKALANDISQDRRVTDKLLDTLVVLGCTLEEYLHLLLPPLVRLFEQPADNEPLRKKAIMTVDKLADTLDVSQFGSMIIHGLIRVIDSPCSTDLKDVSGDVCHCQKSYTAQRLAIGLFRQPFS